MDFIELTSESKKINELNILSQMKESIRVSLEVAVKKGFNAVWNDPEISPQEVFDLMGTNAGYSLNVSKSAQLLLKAIDPNYQILVPDKKYTTNQDGTVTVESENQ